MSEEKQIDVLRVSSSSVPNKVASAIAANFKYGDVVEVQAIGADSVNQMVKASTIARGYMIQLGYDICIKSSFVSIQFEGAEKTAIRFSLKKEKLD